MSVSDCGVSSYFSYGDSPSLEVTRQLSECLTVWYLEATTFSLNIPTLDEQQFWGIPKALEHIHFCLGRNQPRKNQKFQNQHLNETMFIPLLSRQVLVWLYSLQRLGSCRSADCISSSTRKISNGWINIEVGSDASWFRIGGEMANNIIIAISPRRPIGENSYLPLTSVPWC